jgi:hypothetical protein
MCKKQSKQYFNHLRQKTAISNLHDCGLCKQRKKSIVIGMSYIRFETLIDVINILIISYVFCQHDSFNKKIWVVI